MKRLEGYFSEQFFNSKQLITAEIFYYLPDYRDLLQVYIWQHLDVVPKLPELKDFLGYWQRNLEGPVHSVTVCPHSLLEPTKVTLAIDELELDCP